MFVFLFMTQFVGNTNPHYSELPCCTKPHYI